MIRKFSSILTFAFALTLWSTLAPVISFAQEQLNEQPTKKTDFARLTLPAVAQSLRLTDEQNSKVTELLGERSQAMIGAADGKAVIAAYEEKLAAVLTDEQKQKFESLGDERTISFNFQGQKWPALLVWFAKQADLSLVASSTPNGQFVYSSDKKYTPTEALDLLNRVLHSKGHSLIRKGKLLFCVDLSKGLPVGLIPRVALDELQAMGELEFATTILPLSGRPIDAVNNEIEPMLGKYGRSLPLAQTNQLMLTGTVSDLRSVATLIESIPLPPGPKQPAPPKPGPPPPELRVHNVKGVAIELAVGTLKKLLSEDVKLTFDKDTQQISAFVVPSQHAVIESTLQTLSDNLEAGKTPFVEAYSYENSDPESLAKQLQFAVPDIAVNVDVAGERLLVFASPAKQQAVKNTLKRLDVSEARGDEQVLVYELRRGSDSAQLVTILAAMVPEAEVTTDEKQRKVVVRATPEDHQVVDQLIEKIQPRGLDDERKLESYGIDDRNRSLAEELIREMYPDLKLVIDNSSNQLMIWATSDEHARIKLAIDKLPQPDDKELVFHPLKDRKSAREIRDNISGVIRDLNVREHDGGRSLAVIATKEKQAEVREMIAKLEAARRPEPNRTLTFYPLKVGQKDRFNAMKTLLGEELEGMKTFENSAEEIGIWATPKQHTLVKQMMSSAEGALDASKRQLRSYPVEKGEPKAVAELLSELYTEAKIVPDDASRRVMVWAKPTLQGEISESVRQLDMAPDESNKQTLKIYPIGEFDPLDLKPVLSRVAPDASVSGDRGTKSMVVWATKKEHEKIETAIKQFRETNPNEPILSVYPAGKRDYSEMRTFLRSLAPRSTLTYDEATSQFGVLATAAQHESIKKSLELFAAGDGQGEARTIVSYPVTMDADWAIQVLREVTPKAQLIDAEGDTKVIAYATAEEHQLVKSTIDQMDNTGPESDFEFRVYRSNRSTASSIHSVFRNISPRAVVVPDGNNETISIWAPKEDQAKFAKVISTVEATRVTEQIIEQYDLAPGVEPEQATEVINQVAPPASVVSAGNEKIIVVGVKEDHDRIKRSIDALNNVAVEKAKQQVEVYSFDDVNTASIVAALSPQLDDEESIEATNDGLAVMVRATETRQPVIRELVQRVASELPKIDKTIAKVYSLEHVSPAVAQPSLAALLPAATLTIDVTGKKLLATATPADHDRIQQAITALDVPKKKNELSIVRVEDVNASSVVAAIQPQLLDDETIEVDADAKAVLVRAPAERQETIRGLVDRVLQELPQVAKTEARVYSFKHVSPAIVQPALVALLPSITVAVDQTGRNLLATATVDDHVTIKQTIDQLDVERAENISTQVYRLEHTDSSTLSGVMQGLAPTATVVPSPANNVIVVTANEEDQAKFTKLVEEIDKPSKNKPVLVTYPTPGLEPSVIENNLQEIFRSPTFSVTADSQNGAILALATLDEHKVVADVISKISAGKKQSPDATLKTHLMGQFEVDEAIPAFEQLFNSDANPPQFTYSVSEQGYHLYAVASEQQHKRIDVAVKKMQEDLAAGNPVVLVYSLLGLDADAVEDSLQEMLYDTSVRATADAANNALLVKASLKDHQLVNEVVQKLKDGTASDSKTALKVYRVGFVDSDAAMIALDALFADDPILPSFSIDFWGRQVMAVATDDQHQRIAAAIKQIEGEPQMIQGYKLEKVDPLTAMNAINSLYEGTSDRPQVNIDDRTQQVFVRGFRQQVDAVRELLVGMGETNLDGRAESQATFRVFQVQGDSEKTMEQIKKVWADLNDNPLEVISPEQLEQQQREDDQPTKIDNRSDARVRNPSVDRFRTKFIAAPQQRGATNRATPAPPEEQAEGRPAAAEQRRKAKPPIVAVPSDGKITVMSDDPEAIRNFERLLRLIPQTSDTRQAGNFSVVMLNEASAVQVARMLERLIRGMPESELSGFSGVQVAADDRLNAVVVHGRRHERENVEQLLRILDSSNVRDSLAADVPTIFQVKNTDAKRINSILQTIYKTQLQTGGRSRDITIPETVDPAVAGVLKQINATNAAPLLTLEVDDVTNSIVILAPKDLRAEVARLISDLDERAVASSARGVSIIKLKKMNTDAVEETLQKLLRR